jgi:ACR3 family arsenite efflux pump ArsB
MCLVRVDPRLCRLRLALFAGVGFVRLRVSNFVSLPWWLSSSVSLSLLLPLLTPLTVGSLTKYY